jgi:hypothetical protein
MSKVIGCNCYKRRWNVIKSTESNTWQADFEMLRKKVKVHINRKKGPDI